MRVPLQNHFDSPPLHDPTGSALDFPASACWQLIMKLNKQRLREIIIEELDELAQEKRRIQDARKKRTDARERRERTKRSVGVPEDMMRLSRGMLEADKKKKKSGPGCKGAGNPFHSGRDSEHPGSFTNPDTDPKGSWSCPEKGQTSRKGRSLRFTKVKCGRDEKYRCVDGSEKWEESKEAQVKPEDNDSEYIRIRKDALERIIKDEFRDMFGEQEIIEGGNPSKQQRAQQIKTLCNRSGYIDKASWLQFMNMVARSEKGDLNEPPKTKKS